MNDKLIFELARELFEARIREAWGAAAQDRIDKTPWPKHIAAERAAEHDLAIAQAKMMVNKYHVEKKL